MRADAERWRSGWAPHHANDHRAHVATVLGANRLPVPAFDAWTYAEMLRRQAIPDASS